MKALNKYLIALNQYSIRNEGEMLIQNQEQFAETEDLENLILVLLQRSSLWHSGRSFNYDYRTRILNWLQKHENDSVVVYAGLTRLMEIDASDQDPVVTNESLAKRIPIRDKVDLSKVSEEDEMKLWLVDPEFIRENSTRFSSFVTDRSKFIKFSEFLTDFKHSVYGSMSKGKKKLRTEKAIFDLMENNLTESTASFRFLRQYYTELEIAAFNVRLYYDTTDIRSDNIKVRFLNYLCNITENEIMDEFMVSVIQRVVSEKFTRNVDGVTDCKAYFMQLIHDRWWNDYHPVYTDIDSYLSLYYTIESSLDFRFDGFLAFNPLKPEYEARFYAISKKHRMDLLFRNIEEMYKKNPKERYSEEQMIKIRKLYEKMVETCWDKRDQNGKVTDIDLFTVLYEEGETNVTNALIQCGFIDLNRVAAEKDISWFLRNVDRARLVLFTIEFWKTSGILLECLLSMICLYEKYGSCQGMDELRGIMKNNILTDDEKHTFFSMYLECVWKYKKDRYRAVVENILTENESVARFFMTEEEMQGAIKAMYPRIESTPQVLVRYILNSAEYMQYQKERQQEEETEEELRRLKNLQAYMRNALKDLTGSAYTNRYTISHNVRECVSKCDVLRQPFTKIALRYIKESSQGVSISEIVNRMSLVTCDTGCDDMLLEELQKFMGPTLCN